MLGEHGGVHRYTVGQRKGLGGGFARPLYVLGVRPDRNEVVVGAEEQLARDRLELGDLNWLEAPPTAGERVLVRIRHRAERVGATVEALEAAGLRLRLDVAQRAITPGQSGALYRGEVLVGGGRIR